MWHHPKLTYKTDMNKFKINTFFTKRNWIFCVKWRKRVDNTFDLSDENLLCITLTMHAKILLADSNIAPSITKRAKLFVLFCVVPPSFYSKSTYFTIFFGAKKTYNQLEFSVLTNKSSWEKELFYSTVFLRLVHLYFSEFSRNKRKVILRD